MVSFWGISVQILSRWMSLLSVVSNITTCILDSGENGYVLIWLPSAFLPSFQNVLRSFKLCVIYAATFQLGSDNNSTYDNYRAPETVLGAVYFVRPHASNCFSRLGL